MDTDTARTEALVQIDLDDPTALLRSAAVMVVRDAFLSLSSYTSFKPGSDKGTAWVRGWIAAGLTGDLDEIMRVEVTGDDCYNEAAWNRFHVGRLPMAFERAVEAFVEEAT